MFTKQRRDELLATAKSVCEKARDARRDLTAAEQQAVDTALAEAKSINEKLAGEAKSRGILSQLDAMAADVYRHEEMGSGTFGGKTAHLALTGEHASRLADRLVKSMPRDSMGTKALASGQQTVSTILLPEVVPQGRPALSVLDVLPLRIVTPSYAFLRQSVRTLNAAPVAPGGTKPTSTVSVQSVENRLRVVAHISEQIQHYMLSDNVNLERFVVDELVYGLRVAVEAQVLTGDGTGENFTGVLSTSGIDAQPFNTDILTTVRKAITRLDGQGYTPGVIVLHANDWEAVELLMAASGATDTRGVPIDPVARRLWGVPVVVNTALGAGVGLVIGDGAVTVDHDGRIETKWSDAVGTDFSQNAVRCRVEGRFGVSVNQPAAVVELATAETGS